ncbi:hypothetical protein ABID58_005348 [Bradyrhizobium sp. S3.2.6]|uniref:hypothetical protein n=1 Tax=Bradyrhizobium sp. S3.2.6 TaxID=3156428 RepID=UPI0033919662
MSTKDSEQQIARLIGASEFAEKRIAELSARIEAVAQGETKANKSMLAVFAGMVVFIGTIMTVGFGLAGLIQYWNNGKIDDAIQSSRNQSESSKKDYVAATDAGKIQSEALKTEVLDAINAGKTEIHTATSEYLKSQKINLFAIKNATGDPDIAT